MPALVETRDVFAVYPSPTGGVAALQGLTFAVEEGELCVVLGPSGSGKSTLMRVLAGFERPSAGSVVVAGVDLGQASRRQLSHHRTKVLGYADQHYWRALAGELTAEELVGVSLGLGSVSSADRQSRARALLERVGLLDRAPDHPAELSGGEQQRVAICAALAHRPRLLIADEPTGELDAVTAGDVYALLAELVAENDTTAILVSHDPASMEIADRVVHIRDGRVSDERYGSQETVVVGAGGWLRLSEDVLRPAGIGDRAVVVPRAGFVELHPVAANDRPDENVPPLLIGARGATLEACSVTRRYGAHTALDGVVATFEPGLLTVVTGPSGSGKSTLLRVLAGLDVPDDGDVKLEGASISILDRDARAELRRRRIAVIRQEPGLSDFLTARENIELGLALRGVGRPESSPRASEALAIVGLAEHGDRRVAVLSAGQRERVALARVFAARTEVVLADEPTARLDATTTVGIGRLLADLAHRTGTTVVCATHDPLFIDLADREVRLQAGAHLTSV